MKLFLHMELKSQPEEKDINPIVRYILADLGLKKSTSNVELHYKNGDLDEVYKIVIRTKEDIPALTLVKEVGSDHLNLVKGISDES